MTVSISALIGQGLTLSISGGAQRRPLHAVVSQLSVQTGYMVYRIDRGHG